MALNGDTRQSPEHWHGKPPTHSSFDSWVNKNGKNAYQDFVKGHPKTGLSYDAWRQTDQVYGGYLFYVASLVWAEDGESDEESVKRRRISRVQGENSKKTATTNGNGSPRTAGSATPTPAAVSEEISASGKRKRKPRKKYMSQEIVASDEEATDDAEAATPPAEVDMPAALDVTVNGRRKSNSRKLRKKPISDETISPEDENDDTMMEVVAPVIASSPLPVRSAARTSATGKQPESPKKATPKQASAKKSRKSLLVRLPFRLWDVVNLEEKSEEMVLDEEIENGDASVAEVSRPASTPAAKSKSEISNNIKTDPNADDAGEVETAEGTPDPSAANTRRGLRNRKPAQQRPYYHDAQVFEDVETEQDEDSELESLSREQSPEPAQPSRPKHFKGKGRAWKKDGSDEDEEFVTPKEKKAAKAAKAKADREKAKAEKETGEEQDITWALMDALDAGLAELDNRPAQQNGSSKDTPKQKKTRKPRKSNLLSEEVARDESDPDTPQPTPSQPPKRGRGRPRKSALSSEIVRDDSDDNAAAPAPASKEAKRTSPALAAGTAIDLTTATKATITSRPSTANTAPAVTPRKRGRPRKSEATAASTTSVKTGVKAENKEEERRESKDVEAEGKSTRARASISSAPAAADEVQDYAMPAVNHGAALVESLYPREVAAVAAASTAAPADAPADVPAVASEDKPTQEEKATAGEDVERHKDMEKNGDIKKDDEVERPGAAQPQAPSEPKEPAPPASSATTSEAIPQPENNAAPVAAAAQEEDNEDAQSAAMSLSDDSEL